MLISSTVHCLANKLRIKKFSVLKLVLLQVDNNTNVSGIRGKGKVHLCTCTEALCRPYGPLRE